MELSRREMAVLEEVVVRYIRDGQPVSSRCVASSGSVDLSPASIRNVMSELEGKGLLQQPHPSAGRVPTDPGIRLVVDSVARVPALPARTRRELEAQMALRRRELVEDLGWVAELVAHVTREAGLAARPLDEERLLEVVSLIRLGAGRVLGIVVTDDGRVEKRVVELPGEVAQERLQEVSNFLNFRFSGQPMERIVTDVRTRFGGASGEEGTFGALVVGVVDQLFVEDLSSSEVVVVGAEKLVEAEEFTDAGRLRSAVSALEDRAALLQVIRDSLTTERTAVVIGTESELTGPGELGMVTTLFFHEGRRIGAVGVVGPRRMDYLKIVPVVEFIGDRLTSMLDGDGQQSEVGVQ